MTCLITKNQKAKTIISRQKLYLSLKAPSNKVKLQSDKTLTTRIIFFLTKHQMGFFINKIKITSRQKEEIIRRNSKINQHFSIQIIEGPKNN